MEGESLLFLWQELEFSVICRNKPLLKSTLKACFSLTAQVRIQGLLQFPLSTRRTLCSAPHTMWKLGKFGSLGTVEAWKLCFLMLLGKENAKCGYGRGLKRCWWTLHSHNPPWNGGNFQGCLLHLHSYSHNTFLKTLRRINATKIKTWNNCLTQILDLVSFMVF